MSPMLTTKASGIGVTGCQVSDGLWKTSRPPTDTLVSQFYDLLLRMNCEGPTIILQQQRESPKIRVRSDAP